MRRLLAIVCFLLVANVFADWPQFRGPGRDGLSSETGLLGSWSGSAPRELWRVPLGGGFSGLSVVGDRLYTLASIDASEYVVCHDIRDGSQLWKKRIDKEWKDQFGDGPRSTPTVSSGRLFAVSARGTFVALDARSGKRLWSHDLNGEFGARPPTWGVSTSPLVEGDLVILDVGGRNGASIVAFDAETGAEAWRSQNDKAAYSTPIAVTIGGQRQIVAFTGTRVVGLSADDGTLRWRWPWKTSYDVNAATPIFIPPNRVFVSSGYDVGAALLQIDVARGEASIRKLWKNRSMKNKFSSSILHDDHLYGFDEKTLTCIDVETGSVRWKTRGLGHGSLIYADDRLYVLGDKGTLLLVEATPEHYRETGRVRPFKGKTWTLPTIASGRLFLRNEKELVAFEIAENGGNR